MLRFIKKIAPQAEKVSVLDGGIYEGFLHMVYARNLIRESGTFSLWAALANEHGVIFSPRGTDPPGLDRFIDVDAPVLLPIKADALNITASHSDVRKVIKWLEEN